MTQSIRLFAIAAALVSSASAFAQGADAGGVRTLPLPQGAYSIQLMKVEYPSAGQSVAYDEACVRYQQQIENGNVALCSTTTATSSDLVTLTVQYSVGHDDPNLENSLNPASTQEGQILFYPSSFSANALSQIMNVGRNSGRVARSLFSMSTSTQDVTHQEAGSDSAMCQTDENGQLPFNGAFCQGEQVHNVTQHFTVLSVRMNDSARH